MDRMYIMSDCSAAILCQVSRITDISFDDINPTCDPIVVARNFLNVTPYANVEVIVIPVPLPHRYAS